jgi:hypothetical protein
MDEAIEHVVRVAECGRQEARDTLVQAILDGEIRSRFGDDGLQEIKAFLWQYARQWAPNSGLGARAPNRVRISGDPAYLRPFFDPPPDPALLPDHLRPVDVRREDVERLWPARPGSQDEDRRAFQRMRRKWRSEWIARFAERQRIARRWIALINLVDWCAQSTTAASDDKEAKARVVAYRRLVESMRRGEFERDGRSKLLYLDTLVTADGASPRCRLTREQFEIAFDVAAMPPAPSLPLTVLNCCWLPSDVARRWLESHGYRWAPHFEPPAHATAEFFRHFMPSRGRASSAGPEDISTEPANAKPEGEPERAGEDDALSHSGFPGRPSKGRHLIEDEFRRRMNAGKTLASVADEAAVLLE